MMSRKTRRIAAYIGMPLLFTILGYAVIYIAFTPVITMVKSYGSMMIVKGAPSYSNEFDPNMSKLVINTSEIFDKNKILIPELEAHYANISCETVGLEAPIYYGDSDTILSYGVGQYPASGLPGSGKPILIGGHDETYFASLEQIKVGDTVLIDTNYGKFEYKVTSTKVTDAMDTKAYNLDQQKEQLILYTCYPFGQVVGDSSGRYFVYCDSTTDRR